MGVSFVKLGGSQQLPTCITHTGVYSRFFFFFFFEGAGGGGGGLAFDIQRWHQRSAETIKSAHCDCFRKTRSECICRYSHPEVNKVGNNVRSRTVNNLFAYVTEQHFLTRTRKREPTRGVRGHAPPGKFEILFF